MTYLPKSVLFDRIDAADRVPVASVPKPPAQVHKAFEFEARVYWTFADIEPLWAQIEADGASTAYQCRNWIKPILSHLVRPKDGTPFFVGVVDVQTKKVVMLAPFLISRRVGVRVVSWLNLRVCDYAVPLLASREPLCSEAAAASWQAIRAVLPPSDIIHVAQIPRDVAGLANPLALLPVCRPMAVEAFGIAIDADPDTFVARSMGSKSNRGLRKRRRQLEAEGNVQFVKAQTKSEHETMFDALLKQRLHRFRKLGRNDILAQPHVAAFYRDVALTSVENGGPAHLFGVSVDGVWIATALVLVHSNVLHGIVLSVGEDNWNKFSPGVLIVTELMDWSAKQGLVYFDMTIGSLSYKSALGATSHALYEINTAETFIGSLAISMRAVMPHVKTWLNAYPALFSFCQFLRRQLRRSFSSITE